MTSYRFDAPCGHGDTHPSSCGPWLDYADRRVSTAVTAERERIVREVGNALGHDLEALARDAEGALHCAWPTMFLRVLRIIGWQDR